MRVFILMIILHLIGDFYFQTSKIAKCKNANIGSSCQSCKKCTDKAKFNIIYLLIHSVLYIIPFFILFGLVEWKNAVFAIGIILISHFVVDIISCCLNKIIKQTIVLLIDQAIHLIVIGICCKNLCIFEIPANYEIYLISTLVVLLLCVPSSVLIDKLFKDLFNEQKESGLFDPGSIIGILERLIVFILAYFNSFATIAIIITIKTWARTGDLKESNSFRNKYLLGTLASLVIALMSFVLFKILQ